MKDPDVSRNLLRRSWRAGVDALLQSHSARLVGEWWSRRASVRQRGIAAAIGAAVLTSAGILAITPPAGAMNGSQPPSPGAELLAWGMNDKDQLGQGSAGGNTTWSTVPLDVYPSWPGGTTFLDVSGGLGHGLARTSDGGSVWAWGDNDNGQLGNGNVGGTNPTATRITTGLPNGVTDVAAGAVHNLAVAGGNVYAWGNNVFGQLGTSPGAPVPTPTMVPGLTGVSAVAAAPGPFTSAGQDSDLSGGHSLALTENGEVYSWGLDNHGQLGRDGNAATPMQVTGALAGKTVEAIAAGNAFSLALADGVVYGWGNNWDGEMGTDSYFQDVPAPVEIPGLSGVTRIAAGPYHAMAITDGKVYTWGSNRYEQLGRNVNADICAFSNPCDPTPTQVTGELAGLTVTAIAGGWSAGLALASDGTAYGWGQGAVGNGSDSGSPTPARVTGTGPHPATPVMAIAVGANFGLAVAAPHVSQQQGVLDWGWNCNGQLGNHAHGESHNSNVPVQPSNPTLPDTTDVSAGYYHTLAVTGGDDGGHVYAWGNNNYGQLGSDPGTVHTGNNVCIGNTPSSDDYLDHPTRVGSLSSIVQVAGGQFHSLALAHDGTIWAWGNNVRGQLGDPSFTGPSRAQPAQVQPTWPGTATPVAITAGDFHSMALMDDGTVWAWGDNSNGELGNGGPTSATNPTPTQVQGLDGVDVKYIATGIGHGMAASDTALYTWGLNTFGQLGDGGTAGPVLTAQQVTAWPADTTITAIAAGSYHSLAIGNGDIYAWGAGGNGRLCNSGLADVNVPTKITAQQVPHPVKAVAGGGAHSLFIGDDNQPYACGLNDRGQLGTGNNTQYTTPQPVNMTNYPGQSHTQVAAGVRHSITR